MSDTPKNVAVTKTDPIAHAIERLQSSRSPVLGVVSDDGSLVGTFSDQDAREAMIRNVVEHGLIEGVMNKRPLFSARTASKSALRKMMVERKVPAIALTEGKRFVGIEQLDDSGRGPLSGAVAVIMAGGRGQRLRPLTDKVPKPLLKVGSSSILERIVRAIADCGITKVYMSVNYKARVFEQALKDGSHLGVEIEYLKEQIKLSTAGALSLIPETPKGPVLVTNADILTRLDFKRMLEFHWSKGTDATVAASRYFAPIKYGVIHTEGTRLIEMEEKPMLRVLCNAGIYVLAPKVLRLLKKDEPLAMPDLLSRMREKDMQVDVFPIFEKWFDIGSPEDFQKVLLEFATGEEE
ncbi:MAG: nucleotidyltransferase family protein [Actinomycetota bacterium]|nr:nucleotidyltransferase family protein [Actinomycetota bacterium]